MALLERIVRRIRDEGPMRVRDFMETALLDPDEGYYARGPSIGAEGDFYTAANASLFPRALARFVDAATARLGDGARVVELGGGSGALAAALGKPVTVVEPAEGLARRQRERGLQVVDALEELPPAPTVFLANEVLDALPVHRLLATPDGPREGYIAWEDGRLHEVPGPLSEPALAHAAQRLAPQLEAAGAVEVNLEAGRLLSRMASLAPAAFALFVDYGGAPDELWPSGKTQGTLRGFHAHRVVPPFERPGEQDITADVDFPWIADLARERGWRPAGERAQGEFLADLGLVDDLMQALQQGDMQAYLAGKNLLMPGGLGERFRALALARGPVDETTLPGFRPLPGGGPR